MSENSEGVYKFIEYLELLNEHTTLFKSLVTATEIMGELPLSEEQMEVANILLEKLQDDWTEQFNTLLEIGSKYVKAQKKGGRK